MSHFASDFAFISASVRGGAVVLADCAAIMVFGS